MRRHSNGRTALERSAFVFLLLLALIAPLSVGGVYLWGQLGLVVCATIALASIAWLRQLQHRVVYLPLIAGVPAVLALLSALQLIPLPAGMIRWISPRTHEILAMTQEPFGNLGFHALSLDPPATCLELGKMLLYLLVIVAAFQLRREHHGDMVLYTIVGQTGLVVLIVSIGQTLAFLKMPYGHFGPAQHAVLISPFINPNHAAGFYGICACVTAAAAFHQKERIKVVLWGTAAMSLALAVPLTLSRGGILALGMTFVLVVWLVFFRKQKDRRQLWLLHSAVAIVAILTAYAAYDPIATELSSLSTEDWHKKDLWGEALAMSREFAATGAGRGAFARVFPIFERNLGKQTFEFVENWPIQALTDFGLMVGPLLIVGALFFLLVSLRKARSLSKIALIGAFFFAAVHNLFDFNIEVPGVAIILCLALAALHEGKKASTRDKATMVSLLTNLNGVLPIAPRRALLGGALLTLAASSALVWGHRHDARHWTKQLSRTTGAEKMRQIALRELPHHPADYIFTLALAQAYRTQAAPDLAEALRWLNRTQFLNPTHGPTHNITAIVLWQLGARDQAFNEWKLAWKYDPSLHTGILRRLLSLRSTYSELRKAIPTTELLALCEVLGPRPDEANLCIADHVASNPQDIDALRLGVRWALARGNLAGAREYADMICQRAPHDARGPQSRGEIALVEGNAGEARRLWQETIPRIHQPGPIFRALFLLDLKERKFVEARGHLEQFRRVGSSDRAIAADIHYLSGLLYEKQGSDARALKAFEQASAIQPRNTSYLIALARVAGRLGYHQRIEEIIRRNTGNNLKLRKALESALQRATDHRGDRDGQLLQEWLQGSTGASADETREDTGEVLDLSPPPRRE